MDGQRRSQPRVRKIMAAGVAMTPPHTARSPTPVVKISGMKNAIRAIQLLTRLTNKVSECRRDRPLLRRETATGIRNASASNPMTNKLARSGGSLVGRLLLGGFGSFGFSCFRRVWDNPTPRGRAGSLRLGLARVSEHHGFDLRVAGVRRLPCSRCCAGTLEQPAGVVWRPVA